MNTIESFKGEYRFLSNFFPSPVTVSIKGWSEVAPTVEHAFQAEKTRDDAERSFVLDASTPSEAKVRGRTVHLRPDWEDVKLAVMHRLLTQKFKDEGLRLLLIKTGDAWLVEGNTWGDTYWGEVNGQGENWLGRLLMLVRSEILLASPR